MADFKKLIEIINNSVNNLTADIPATQKKILNDVLLLVKNVDLKGDKIKIAGNNLKLLTAIQGKIQKVILTDKYIKNVSSFVGTYDSVVSVQNEYFKELESKFKPPALVKEIKKQAISSVINNLTESGIKANLSDKIGDILRKSITGGGSYNNLTEQLTNFITTNHSGDGQLARYINQIAKDSINQFSGTYTQMISADLGYEWYRYSGSNIETTRPWCLACVDRKFFHISEIPKVLKGEFEEFKKYDGKIYDKTGLPSGMIPGTDVSNFMQNNGGFNCEHKWRPVPEDQVPDSILKRVHESIEYKQWKGIDVNEKQIIKESKGKSHQKYDIPESFKNKLYNEYGGKDKIVGQKWFEEIKKLHPSVNTEEIATLKYYTVDLYGDLNRYLRKKLNGDEFLDTAIKVINNGLNKLESFDGIVYRGISIDITSVQKYFDAFKTGKSVIEPAFTSTSKNPAKAFDGNAKFMIKSKNGKSVKDFSEYDEEDEVLFKNDSKFKILDIQELEGGYYEISLEEL